MTNAFKGYGFLIDGMLHLSPREANEILHKGAILLDLRLDLLFNNKRFDVPECLHCVYSEIEEYYLHLPANKPIIVADAVGVHSKEIVEFLKGKGFTQVANLIGGICEWERDGLPILIDIDETLTGGCMCQLRTWGKRRK